MAPNSLDFKTAIVTGGGGGIGKAISQYLISQNKKVIIVGRTESKLQEASKEIGATAYYVLDTGDIKSIPAFIKRVTSEHPDVDCLINNAGVQRPLDFNKMSPEDFLNKADNEVSINISGPMHLAVSLLPHFKSKPSAVIMNVSSVLGYIPTSVINPVYNGTKAWVHFFTMNLRTQLAKSDDGKNIKVIEIAPPSVGTDLHREREDPDDNKKDKNAAALSVEEFMDDLKKGWQENKDTIGAGPSIKIVDRWYSEFGGDYSKAAGV